VTVRPAPNRAGEDHGLTGGVIRLVGGDIRLKLLVDRELGVVRAAPAESTAATPYVPIPASEPSA